MILLLLEPGPKLTLSFTLPKFPFATISTISLIKAVEQAFIDQGKEMG